jgi:hypothetical protein
VKKLLPVLFVLALVAVWQARWNDPGATTNGPGSASSSSGSASSSTTSSRASPTPALRAGQQVELEGTVVRVLPDDTSGSRHQRFIVRLPSGQTVLIAHNIDIAPRVDGIAAGDAVQFSGEFEENDKGGVVHWTHHDPSGRHPDGFIVHRGRTYR